MKNITIKINRELEEQLYKMAKMTFNYSVMNAGKSLHLLQVNHNYNTNGKKTLLIKPSIDERTKTIKSRLGVEAEAILITQQDRISDLITDDTIECILIDESQFLSREQVIELAHICDTKDIHIMAYGLKVNAFGELFEGSKALLELCDNFNELKTTCSCGRKATMILRFGADGEVITDGDVIDLGYEEKYQSVCRKHWFEGMGLT